MEEAVNDALDICSNLSQEARSVHNDDDPDIVVALQKCLDESAKLKAAISEKRRRGSVGTIDPKDAQWFSPEFLSELADKKAASLAKKESEENQKHETSCVPSALANNESEENKKQETSCVPSALARWKSQNADLLASQVAAAQAAKQALNKGAGSVRRSNKPRNVERRKSVACVSFTPANKQSSSSSVLSYKAIDRRRSTSSPCKSPSQTTLRPRRSSKVITIPEEKT